MRSPRPTLSRILRRLGHQQIETTSSGSDLIDRVFSDPPEILLLDLDLADVNGIESLETIQLDDRLADLEIVVTTSVRDEAIVQKVIALGVSDYLLKPYQQHVIEERLGAIVRRIKTRAEQAAQQRTNRPKLLLVTAPGAFEDRVVEAFGDSHCIVRCRAFSSLVRELVRHRPGFSILDADLLSNNLTQAIGACRRLSTDPNPSVLLVCEDPTSTTLEGAGGAIGREVDGVELERQVGLLFGRHVRWAWGGASEPTLREAVMQALGMLTGLPMVWTDREACSIEGALSRVRLRSAAWNTDWSLVLSTTPRCAAALSAALLQSHVEELEGEQLEMGPRAMLKVVAGRLERWAEERDVQLETDEPACVGAWSPTWTSKQLDAKACFELDNAEPVEVLLFRGQ